LSLGWKTFTRQKHLIRVGSFADFDINFVHLHFQLNIQNMILRHCSMLAFCLIFMACSQPEKEANIVVNPAETGQPAANQSKKKKTIIFFGDSLTAGYGLENVKSGYVSLVQQRMDSLGLDYHAVNAGLSGETSAGGNERVDWVIRTPVDIFVLELGGNDALRGVQTEETLKNLGSIITKVKTKYPEAKVVLAGMQAPPNMGQAYTQKFSAMYPNLAKEHGATLIPFILANVGGIPDLNQGDRIHPNEKGQYILRENVWKVMAPLL
jgi:acyl-CoA thioesterase I